MSCSPQRLLSYYSNRVNIYDNSGFIPLPNYKTCPPPSMIMLQPNPNNYKPYGYSYAGQPINTNLPPSNGCAPCQQKLK